MLSRLINAQNRRNWHPHTFLLFCAFVGITRGILEILFQRFVPQNNEVLNFIPFYVLLGLLLTLALSQIGNVSFQSVQKSLTIGLFLGLFPPLFDFLLFRNRTASYAYYYFWDFKNLPYILYNPAANFPAGETLGIWLSITFCGAYVYAVRRSIWRALGGIIAGYAIFLLIGAFIPMLIAKFTGLHVSNIEDVRRVNPQKLRTLALDIAFYQALLATPVYLMLRRQLFMTIIKRALHAVPFIMLTILGGVVVRANAADILQAALMTIGVCLTIIVQNEYFDSIEASGKAPTAIQKSDLQILNAFFLLGLIVFFGGSSRGGLPMLIFFICGVLYNYPFYRARNYFPANLKIEGIWGVSAFLTGAFIDPYRLFTSGGLWMTFLIFGGWSTVAVLKDLKDAAADRATNVQTIFTIFLNRGNSLEQIWKYVRITIILLVYLPVWISIGLLPIWSIFVLAGITSLLASTMWLRNHKQAFQIQLGLISLIVFFWQVAFSMPWISI